MIKNKKYLLLISVILFLFGASLILLLSTNAFNNTGNNKMAETQEKLSAQKIQKIIDESKTINLTNNGFTPKEITINSGTRIIWINSSGTKASVNSDPYPVNNYWNFLNMGSFDDGQNFTLIFDKPGTYTYHNQYKPKQVGKIIVK